MLANKLSNKLVRLARASVDLPNSSKKHFSFIVDKNKIISYGFNDGWKTSPLAKQYGHRFDGIHAELAAIKNFPYPVRYLSDFRLVNLRLKADKTLGMARPCPNCLILLRDFGIHEVYFSNSIGELVRL